MSQRYTPVSILSQGRTGKREVMVADRQSRAGVPPAPRVTRERRAKPGVGHSIRGRAGGTPALLFKMPASACVFAQIMFAMLWIVGIAPAADTNGFVSPAAEAQHEAGVKWFQDAKFG